MISTLHNISFDRNTVPDVIPVVQGDTGRVLVFVLEDFVLPEGCAATWYVQKPSGAAVYNTATIDRDENTVTVQLTAQSIMDVGDARLQIRITKDAEVVTSFDALLKVIPFGGIGAVESISEANIFDQYINDALERIQQGIEVPEAVADYLDAHPEIFGSYNVWTDKPQINGVTLQGNKSAQDLNITSYLFPVGSVYVTGTNSNPSSYLGGTWTLIKRVFENKVVTDAVTFNSTNVVSGSGQSVFFVRDTRITFRIQFANKVAIADTTLVMGTIDLSRLGITGIYQGGYIASDDTANAAIMMDIQSVNNEVQIRTVDVVGGGTVAASTSTSPIINLRGELLVSTSSILDSACNEFHWQRTA